MKYFVMRKTLHFEKFRYQIAKDNNATSNDLNELNIAAENALGNFHLSEYDVRLLSNDFTHLENLNMQ